MPDVAVITGSNSDSAIAEKAVRVLETYGLSYDVQVVASKTKRPVIGGPVSGKLMGGLDALLSIVQMPKGVPVACVAVDGGENAAHLAARILGVA
jgi:5-(carboxyamino)imidazole ribonucleotide mutase